MQADRKRVARLKRLAAVRAVAKQAAATEAAGAESTLAQLLALAERTDRLAADYAARTGMADGGQLRQLTAFRAGIEGVARGTAADAARARAVADDKLAELSAAERRRQAAEDRADAAARALAKVDAPLPLGPRKGFGTGLE